MLVATVSVLVSVGEGVSTMHEQAELMRLAEKRDRADSGPNAGARCSRPSRRLMVTVVVEYEVEMSVSTVLDVTTSVVVVVGGEDVAVTPMVSVSLAVMDAVVDGRR
jgi:hypothetical protein